MTGYMHPDYAQSLAEFGDPRELPCCGGWILERPIAGFPYYDAMGCYPLFVCRDWSQLHLDLDDLSDELVSLSMVTDPFGKYNEAYLQRCFRDIVIPFKEHYIVDLSHPIDTILSSKIRARVRKALRNMKVEVCKDAMAFLEDWIGLYETTTERFSIRSVRAFSRAAFTKMFKVPGLVLYCASYQGETIGIALVIVQGDIAFGHLLGISDIGYKLDASYALYWYQIGHLAKQCRWLDLGGIPGISRDGSNDEWRGLRQYKAHWSTGTRTAYFCGRIFDHERYAEITKARGIAATNYFPAYRTGEFG